MRNLSLALSLSVAACGDAAPTQPGIPSPAGDAAEAPGGPAVPTATPAGLAIAFGAPRLAALSAHGSRAIVVEAIYGATALSGAQQLGQITTTGTLRVGATGATYAAEPTDRLVVELAGKRHEIMLKSAQGNSQAADAMAWLSSPHQLRYHHAIAGEAAADFDVRYDGSRFTVKITGQATFGSQRTELDLTAAGQTGGVRDFDGHDLKTGYRITGTLRGEGFTVDVDERHALASVGAQSLRTLPGMRGSASRFEAAISSTLRCGGRTFRFEGVDVVSDTKEKGGVTQNQESSLRGAVSCDGTAFGQCAMAGGVPVLQTTSGALPLAIR